MQHHANSDDPVSHQVAQNATKGDPATIAPPLPERPAMARAGESYRKMAGLARRTVREAHRCGRLLQTAKAELPHGGWLPALAAEGIPVRTAQRCMTLAERYPDIRQIDAFGSVADALAFDGTEEGRLIAEARRMLANDGEPVDMPTFLAIGEEIRRRFQSYVNCLKKQYREAARTLALHEELTAVLTAEEQRQMDADGSAKELADIVLDVREWIQTVRADLAAVGVVIS